VKHQSFIGVGSNLGNRRANCQAALDRLGCLSGTMLHRVSTFVESEPQEGVEGGPFLNAVAEIATSLSPRQLLGSLQEIEVALGRAPDHLPGTARTMDLDLLLYGDAVIREADLTIPHPRLVERWFVLAPLVGLDPELRHPVLRVTMASLLQRLDSEAPRVSPGRVR
jgi:2-amino-4-hydroxy-6-hydroxymethyldihydropteridine diphosphokinase